MITLSYDFLREHAIGRTSNEIARTTIRSIVRALNKNGYLDLCFTLPHSIHTEYYVEAWGASKEC